MMKISGMSGNEIFCLRQKGFLPGDIVVGNSVVSLGVKGTIGSIGRSIAGGEVTQVTELIRDGRHRALERMEEEAKREGASGVTGVVSSITSLAGYTEFLAQGTGVHRESGESGFFSTAASGVELYCHLDTGYEPRRFVMGNVAYALGLGRGIAGTVRTLARGEVKEFSSMYNEIRRTCLARLRAEAAIAGANAVVDVDIQMLPFGAATLELLMTGSASYHPALGTPSGADAIVTSELSGEELWNLAALDEVPLQIVMATSVQSLGVVGSVGSMVQSLSKGELPELTKLVYEAREQCLDMIRREATALGATRVIGHKLQIREIGSGLVEFVALGTAVRAALPAMRPATPLLIPQAVIPEKSIAAQEARLRGLSDAAPMETGERGVQQTGSQLIALGVVLLVFMTLCLLVSLASILQRVGGG